MFILYDALRKFKKSVHPRVRIFDIHEGSQLCRTTTLGQNYIRGLLTDSSVERVSKLPHSRSLYELARRSVVPTRRTLPDL
jgi:hypothetical protein